jgi:hypothetical protein
MLPTKLLEFFLCTLTLIFMLYGSSKHDPVAREVPHDVLIPYNTRGFPLGKAGRQPILPDYSAGVKVFLFSAMTAKGTS